MKKHTFKSLGMLGEMYIGDEEAGVKSGIDFYLATDVDARIAELENALNLIRDGNADDECASPLTKEDMQQIATNVLMER